MVIFFINLQQLISDKKVGTMRQEDSDDAMAINFFMLNLLLLDLSFDTIKIDLPVKHYLMQ